jgi:hypothetical protein
MRTCLHGFMLPVLLPEGCRCGARRKSGRGRCRGFIMTLSWGAGVLGFAFEFWWGSGGGVGRSG